MLDSCHICGASLMKLHGTVKCVACGAVYENLYSNEENVLLENAFETLANTSFEEAEQLFCDLNKNYPENGEAYWGCLLSKYGIKYEKDYDGTMVPTFYKVPDSNMIEDSLLKEAIHNSTENVAHYFESEAKKLEALRIEWVEKASKEPSFDIFISHKSDLEDDSNRAKDIYDALQKNKLRPFYSEESLKDKVGEKYEPYIFQAIEKSKAMVLYVNSPEEVESTWIKNEWHRFAKLVSQKKKVSNSLIIICDGFLAKELPKELAAFQCIEVSNGEDFMPLLLLQINKILKLAKKVNTKKNSKLATQIALLSIVAVAVISIILLVQNSNRDDISSTTNNSSILPSSTTIDSITLEQTTLVDTSATSTSENTSTTLDETTIITDATTTITTDVSTSNEETTVIVGTTTEYTTEYTTEETTQITL
ncbi:MAG: toll/interleukin-1 receptor domain-containing protein [Clostridia bacterium]|nr:toll/interleukin-1 receptor domain-containing protein [Clostridia bacterium]